MTTHTLDGGTRTLTVHADDATGITVTDRRTGQKVHPNRYTVETLKTRVHVTKKRGFFGHGARRWVVDVETAETADTPEAEETATAPPEPDVVD